MNRTTPFFRAVYAIVRKDLRTELRSRQLLSAILLFALMATMVFYYTLEGRPDLRAGALPSVVWVTVVFAGTLGLSRSLAQEQDRGSLDGLLLAPINRSALFFGKMITTWVFSLVVAGLVSFATSLLFNTGLNPLAWTVITLLGTLGFSGVGTFMGSMAIHARGRETTLPILILPVVLPIVMAAVNAANAVIAEQPFTEWSIWLLVLGSVDTIFLVLAYVLFDFVVEE